ncbi:MAG: long-chain fatty acid--CoA ligase [Bacteroidales bacterium]|nr:long-chain fatty acid--CoA ligase [Bacteroidales bacterium]
MQVTRIFDLLERYKEELPKVAANTKNINPNVALAHKVEGQWVTYSIDDYIENVANVSYGLLALGIQPGDKIGIVSENRPEWNFLDMGAMQIGAVPIPIYPTISQEEYRYILLHAEIKLLFIEGKELRKKIEPIIPELKEKSLQEVFTFVDQKNEYRYFKNLVDLGKENPQPEKVAELKAAVKPENLATIIYTSGTTGNPKGVMLSHNNIIKQVPSIASLANKESHTALSFLPLCHVYERVVMYAYHYQICSIYYSNIAMIADNLKDVKPTIMCVVPRLLEKIYDKLYSAGKKQSFIKRKIYYWAVWTAKRYKVDPANRTWWYNLKWKIADKLVYSQWREALGATRIHEVVSGGSALQPQLASFFHAIGLNIFQGYGLTETAPVIAVASHEPYTHEVGTVGIPLPGVEVKIAESGELLCRGFNVMMGYYRNEEMTKEVIDSEGWFHTGDTACITDRGLLKITGRIKSLFKTSFGKYVNPEIIEAKFETSSFIGNIVVYGENRPYPVAIILPDFSVLKTWCASHKVPYVSEQEVVKNPAVVARIKKEVKKYNEKFADYEQVKRFILVAEEWTPQNGMLSPTLKVKRKVVQEKYAQEIETLFNNTVKE